MHEMMEEIAVLRYRTLFLWPGVVRAEERREGAAQEKLGLRSKTHIDDVGVP